MKEKGPIWKLDSNDADIPTNGTNKNQPKESPKLKDIIGSSLKFVGEYNRLDNKKQVVALIDDVIQYLSLVTLNSNDFSNDNLLMGFTGPLYQLW